MDLGSVARCEAARFVVHRQGQRRTMSVRSGLSISALGALALFGVMGPALADSYDRTVAIVNGTGATLVQIYGTAGGGWGANRLRSGAIAPGASATISFEDGSGECRFNVKAVFADGTEKLNNDIDVCQTRRLQFR